MAKQPLLSTPQKGVRESQKCANLRYLSVVVMAISHPRQHVTSLLFFDELTEQIFLSGKTGATYMHEAQYVTLGGNGF